MLMSSSESNRPDIDETNRTIETTASRTAGIAFNQSSPLLRSSFLQL